MRREAIRSEPSSASAFSNYRSSLANAITVGDALDTPAFSSQPIAPLYVASGRASTEQRRGTAQDIAQRALGYLALLNDFPRLPVHAAHLVGERSTGDIRVAQDRHDERIWLDLSQIGQQSMSPLRAL